MRALYLEEILEEISKIKGWQEINQDYIQKTFLFLDYKEALDFTNKISKVAEAQQHHPEITLKYGKVIIKLSTHEPEGITIKDIELAKLIDEIYEQK